VHWIEKRYNRRRRQRAVDKTHSEQMTQTRIHNLSISLDGFATGEGQTPGAPVGTPANGWSSGCSPTRFGAPILGRKGGTAGVDDAFAHGQVPPCRRSFCRKLQVVIEFCAWLVCDEHVSVAASCGWP
jgi:hypothetical protein